MRKRERAVQNIDEQDGAEYNAQYDDEYVERETEYTEAVGSYIEANIDEFLTIR